MNAARALWRRLLRDASGVAMIEFALILPILAVLVFGIVDFGRALNYWIDETHLANEAARFAAVGTNPGADSGLTLQQWTARQATTEELASGSDSVTAPIEVCIAFPEGHAVGEPVEVRVSATFEWLPVLDLGVSETTIEGGSTMRLEGLPPSTASSPVSAGCGSA